PEAPEPDGDGAGASDDPAGGGDDDGQNGTGGRAVVLRLSPDPREAGELFPAGQRFEMVLDVYDEHGELEGTTTDYTLTFSPDADGATYDIGAGWIRFSPQASRHYQFTATYAPADINSQAVDLSVTLSPLAEVAIESPAGNPYTNATAIEVAGRCTLTNDARRPCQGVRVNGIDAVNSPQPGKDWSNFTIGLSTGTGLFRVRVEAINEYGVAAHTHNLALVVGDTRPEGLTVTTGVVARANGEALDAVAESVTSEMASLDLGALAPSPFVTDSQGAFTASLDVEDPPGITHQAANVAIEPNATGARVTMAFDDVSIPLSGGGMKDGSPWSGSGTFAASRVGVRARLAFSPGGGGVADVTLADVEIEIDDATLSGFDAVGAAFETALFDAIEAALADLTAQAAGDALAPALDGAFSKMQVASTGAANGKTVSMGGAFTFAASDDGGLSFAFDVDATASAKTDASLMPGSFRRAGAAPAMGATAPDGLAYAFGVVVDDDLFNQVLYELERAGAFDVVVGELTTADIAGAFHDLYTLYPGADVELRFAASLPPIFVYREMAGELAASLGVANMRFDIVFPGADGGDDVFALSANLTFELAADAGENDGRFMLAFDTAGVSADVTLLSAMPGAELAAAQVADFMPTIAGMLAPVFEQAFKAIALPRFVGLEFDVTATHADGVAEDFLGVYGGIAP
ncbi:hypothetical protein K8I61_19120, partial [bacterium]|nr:hypothetical protein [bacterium]